MHEMTAFQRDLLIVIAGLDAPAGTTINAELDQYYEKTVEAGRLYPNLDDLVEQGLADKTAKDGRTNEYSVTDFGHTVLESHLDWKSDLLD